MGGLQSVGENAYSIKKTNENLLGTGTFAEVYKIKSKKDKYIYAAKIFKQMKSLMEEKQKLFIESELSSLK